MAESGIKGPKEVEKQFIRTMTVQKVKALLYRTFAIPRVPLSIMVTSCRVSINMSLVTLIFRLYIEIRFIYRTL